MANRRIEAECRSSALVVKITPLMHNALKDLAHQERESKTEIVVRAIKQYLLQYKAYPYELDN